MVLLSISLFLEQQRLKLLIRKQGLHRAQIFYLMVRLFFDKDRKSIKKGDAIVQWDPFNGVICF